MRRSREPPREGYRESASPEALPLTVIVVRPGEYAEPAWVDRVRKRVRHLVRALRRGR